MLPWKDKLNIRVDAFKVHRQAKEWVKQQLIRIIESKKTNREASFESGFKSEDNRKYGPVLNPFRWFLEFGQLQKCGQCIAHKGHP